MGKIKVENIDRSMGKISIKDEPEIYEDKLKDCGAMAKTKVENIDKSMENIFIKHEPEMNEDKFKNSSRIAKPKGKIKVENNDESMGNIPIKNEPEKYEDKLKNCSVIAKPMATKKLSKIFYKLIKKASGNKKFLNCGLKLVQKQVRLGHKGIVVFAGDISPIEIMCHMPCMCEDNAIPYCYVPSRQDIGHAMGVKRGCLMVLIREHEDYKDLYDECKSELKNLPCQYHSHQ